jgi:hypothetical protein
MEKGSRALYLGIKPHSKGLSLSWSLMPFFEKNIPMITTTLLNTSAVRERIINIKILDQSCRHDYKI